MIRARDVTVRLGEATVLDGVDVDVDEGQFVGLVGANGAGKTTLLRALNGTVTPDRGTVHVDGDRLDARSTRAVARLVGTVPQETSLDFAFTVRDVVSMGRTPHVSRFGQERAEDRRAVDAAMARAAVTTFADRPITDVSGGERQRVLLARALAQETPVLLLDEPTANLDINHQVKTLELVRDLVDDGRTVVAAIHDLTLAARYCDELVLLVDGQILASGTPESVLTESTVERAFAADAVVARHPVTGTTTVTALGARGDATGRVHVVGGGGAATRYLYLLDEAGYTVSVGALNEGDTDAATAADLGIETVTVDPFAAVDDAAREAVRERVVAADVVVVTDIAVGTGNLPNLRVACDARELVLVEARPFDDRNFAGSAGERVYEELTGRGTVVAPEAVLSAVEAAVSNARKRRSSAPLSTKETNEVVESLDFDDP